MKVVNFTAPLVSRSLVCGMYKPYDLERGLTLDAPCEFGVFDAVLCGVGADWQTGSSLRLIEFERTWTIGPCGTSSR